MVILQGREKGIKRTDRSLNIFNVFLIVKFYTTMYLNDTFIPGSYSYSSFERRKGTNIKAKTNIVVDLAIVLPFTLIQNVHSTSFYTPFGFTDVFNPNL